ncbi:hypothetical protein [Actinomadura montaniterrae]|uniref:Uncharacterized protein n=1 Tax=Actinomadura montaniterrae TaxID=1803903 RepID=A0A6L3VZU3_9ACTN|nr:hypothetical protein [Actinomadura montaniterrae]KAB2381879.1 hypothetical protein F9B16_15290 [Actinomadura montaniterrae]
MAGVAARAGTVPVPLRRALTGRIVRRLLVLAGLLIAGWLLGGMAQQATARAAELPAPPVAPAVKAPPAPAEVVADGAPVLAHVLKAPRTPIPSVAGAVKHPASVRALAPAGSAKPVPPESAAEAAAPADRHASPQKAHSAPRRAARSAVPARRSPDRSHAASGTRQASHVRHHRALERHPAPFQAPGEPGTHSATCGGVPIGAAAGLPAAFPWAPVPPRARVPRNVGAVPPAVRTAADEPSFAPD